jgi:hypothetical protein
MRSVPLVLCLALTLPVAVSRAAEATITPDYLQGTWSLDGKTGCGSGDSSHYVLFRNNGTLEVGQAGRVQRVGFWRISGDAIVANTLTAPTTTEEYHPFFGDSYRYEYVAPQVVKVEPGSFAVLIGSDLEKEKREVMLTRCP